MYSHLEDKDQHTPKLTPCLYNKESIISWLIRKQKQNLQFEKITNFIVDRLQTILQLRIKTSTTLKTHPLLV